MAKETVSIVDVLEKAGQDDLDEVNHQIAGYEKKLDSLKKVRTILEAKMGFRKPRKSPTKRKAGGDDESPTPTLSRVLRFLLHAGPSSLQAISANVSCPPGPLAKTLNANQMLFNHRDMGGQKIIELTALGRETAEDGD